MNNAMGPEFLGKLEKAVEEAVARATKNTITTGIKEALHENWQRAFNEEVMDRLQTAMETTFADIARRLFWSEVAELLGATLSARASGRKLTLDWRTDGDGNIIGCSIKAT